MTKPYYVTLTGSKDNSGDHLIRDAALTTFKIVRPDRDIVDFNGWEKISPEKLQIINNAQALILVGGPALRMDTYPKVYALVDDLDSIKVPIITLGIGYKHKDGSWEKTKSYEFTDKTLQLLTRIENSGYYSSVRCYNTLNTLLSKGFKKFVMGGCPAFYQSDFIGKTFPDEVSFNNVAFSTGREYLENDSIANQERDLIKSLSAHFATKNFIVTFHHPIDKTNVRTNSLINFLDENKINYLDVSGSVDSLRNFYKTQDLHIGYRVHAHIFMTSTNMPSILLAEDGRGVGMKTTLGGLIFESYKVNELSIVQRILIKFGFHFSVAEANKGVFKDVVNNLSYEANSKYQRFKTTRQTIDQLYNVHKQIIEQLP